MPPSTPPRKDQLAGNWLEAKWFANTRTRFFDFSKNALKWPPVSHNFCLAGVDPEKLFNVTYGSSSELDTTLHNIYAEHGPVELQVRGRDIDGRYYLKCSEPGNKHAPAKAVICVSPANVKDRAVAAEAEPTRSMGDGKVQDREDWEEVVIDDVEQDEWVKV